MAVIFELSRNTRLLEQYYKLREERFREDLGIPAFDGSEEMRDRQGDVLLAHRDGKCVGGIRIAPCTLSPTLLDDLEYSAPASCFWERLVLAPEVRTTEFFRQFCDNTITMTQALGYRHAIVLSSRRTARFYRKLHTGLGVGFHILRPAPDHATGAFSGLEHYLSVAHLEDRAPLAMVA